MLQVGSNVVLRGFLVLGGIGLVVSAAWAAQEQDARFTAQDADEAFARLRVEVPGLRATWNFDTGFPSFVFGRAIDLFGEPRDAAQFEATARRVVDLFPGLFGYDASVLVTEQVKHLRLSSIGTTDKVSVGFSQWVGGLPVIGSTLHVLFDAGGAILGIENAGLPNVGAIDVVPTIDDAQATRIAREAFNSVGPADRADRAGAQVRSVEIAIVPNAARTAGALAWIVALGGSFDEVKQLPIAERIAVDAHTGAVIRRESTIHSFTDLKGTTSMYATPGTLPDTAANVPVSIALKYGDVKSSVGDTRTGVDGKWRITYSGSTVQTVTWSFSSTSAGAWVDDRGDSDYTKTKSVTPGIRDLTSLNKSPTQYNTAEMNAQHHAVNFREWIVAIDPTEATMDFRQRLNVNRDASCNAYYDGSSTNYYRLKGGCNNTAYSTIIAHEVGHWANDLFGSGNGGDGFGEGAADTWAMYIYDTPIVAEDFYTSGNDLRDGRNTRQYCGSCGAGCYGEVHNDGEVMMGAFWKVRDHLNLTLGDAAGDAVADPLWLAWFQAYDASTICDTNLSQWLTLDDDNGDLSDGTPHSADINQGFVDQGYPSYY